MWTTSTDAAKGELFETLLLKICVHVHSSIELHTAVCIPLIVDIVTTSHRVCLITFS